MFSNYFSVASALSKSDVMPSYASAMLGGDFENARRHLERQIHPDTNEQGEFGVPLLQAMADVSVLLGRDEDAEENFRKAQKLIHGSNDDLRIFSCRNTGWQALSLHRYSAALNCFARITQDAASRPQQKIEAIVGVAIIHHQLGQQSAADEALAHALVLTEEVADNRWRALVELLELDFSVRLSIRCSAGLKDHVFWQSASPSPDRDRKVQRLIEPSATAPVAMLLPGLMAQRYNYLALLMRLSTGDRNAIHALTEHMTQARNRECDAESNSVRLEIALAALAGNFVDLAEQALSRNRTFESVSRRWNLDYLYCQAKICMQRGRIDDAMKFYTCYSSDALQCLRNETQVIKPLEGIVRNSVMLPTDDVSARLPARYRRAYRYILDNFKKNDLTTREVAAHICVTERALQMVFKQRLGMSPTAVIRRSRLEAVRTELLNENNGNESIIETANRQGLKSRSALIRGYRKEFHELPSETSHR